MVTSDGARWEKRVPAALASALVLPKSEVGVAQAVSVPDVDLVLTAQDRLFVVGVKATSSPAAVAREAEHLVSSVRKLRRAAVPLVVVPFMTPAARSACERAAASWLDLSGNAHITAPGLRVVLDGKPNAFRKRGRPSSVFAPKSARIARWLLMHPKEALTQQDLATRTDVSEGLVSRVISRLEDQQLVSREDGRVRLLQPELLLDAWRDEHRFAKNDIVRGHVAARSGDALTRFVAETLSDAGVRHAATGLSAAWQLTHFAGFRIATFYLESELDPELEARMGFRDEPRGANLWLVLPKDVGVFDGSEERDGVRCVHPVQVVLDLAEHPERAAEAAERVRKDVLQPTWE
ncbi:MAG: type IV toxin-antitoxin system AbiEi family antitoxin [Myxococcota bacterium]|jgi:hypothetical protein|nr:type IV toxin-antitoxin system AbiEi family antitoxin [Myxococcota bacterium]